MAIARQAAGRWKADVEPAEAKGFRKTLKTKAEALRFEAACRAKLIQQAPIGHRSRRPSSAG